MSIHVGFTQNRRPIIKNVDGGFTVEEMATVRVGAEWMNVYLMYGARTVTPEEAIEILQARNWSDPDTGRAIERFHSWGEAQKALLTRRLEVVNDILQHGFS